MFEDEFPDEEPSDVSGSCASDSDEDVPPEWEIEGPAVTISLGDATDVDPALLAAIAGPDGLGGETLGPQFGQHSAADVLRPNPLLAALTEQVVSADMARLTDNQLIGALRASLRLQNREAFKQAVLIAEFGRRRLAELEAAVARGVPSGRCEGEFLYQELAMELVTTRVDAERRTDDATDVMTRLPATRAALAAGLIDADRAGVIAYYTRSLTADDAAMADEFLATLAPGLRVDQLARKAAALEMKLAPDAVKARKEYAKRTRQRVEVRREDSGNASLAGREMDNTDVLAAAATLWQRQAGTRRHAGVSRSSAPTARPPPTPAPMASISFPPTSGPPASGPPTSRPHPADSVD
jgi:hypothetical protein